MKLEPHEENEFVLETTIAKRNLQLSVACQKGNIDAVRKLLKNRIHINSISGSIYGSTPLNIACYYKKTEVVKALIEAGADVNKKSKNNKTPLLNVCDAYEGDSEIIAEIVKILLKNGADSSIYKKNSDGPLHYAAMYGHVHAVRLLVKYGADVNSKGGYHRTALIYAASTSFSSIEIVKILLKAKANVKAKNQAGENALFELITRDKPSIEIAELLIDKGINIHTESKHNGTPLHWASFCGRKNIVELLIKKGAKVNKKSKNGNLPILRAMSQHKTDIVKLLIENGANPNSSGIMGWNVLEYAVEKEKMELVKLVISKSKETKKGFSSGALAEAAKKGDLKMVKFLIKAGINADDRSSFGSETALIKAAYYGKLNVLKYLLEIGADIKACDYRGNTPLLNAAWSGHTKLVRELLKQGAKINERNKLNWNSLMQACVEGHFATAKLLLEKGSPTDEIDKEKGATALTLAKFSNSQKIVDLLLSHNANERTIKMRKEDEPYFSIFNCDICFYLPNRKSLANTDSPENFKGLEIIYKDESQFDRYGHAMEMLKKCTNCGTYYHHDHSIDTEDAHIAGPRISHHIQRYNLIRIKQVLENIGKKDELKEFENKYSEIINQMQKELLNNKKISENFLPYIIESLTDYYIMNDDWKLLSKNLLQHSNPHIVLDTVYDLTLMYGITCRNNKFPRYRDYRDCIEKIQDKLKPMIDKNVKELFEIINKYKNSKDERLAWKYKRIMDNVRYYKINPHSDS